MNFDEQQIVVHGINVYEDSDAELDLSNDGIIILRLTLQLSFRRRIPTKEEHQTRSK
jgi:antitoxin component of MazEF toxin-antitoxin module